MAWTVCGFCGRKRNDPAMAFGSFGVCRDCMEKLPYTSGGNSFSAMPPLDYLMAPFYYTGVIKTAVRKYKFDNQRSYADIFAEFILRCIADNKALDDFRYVCAVPISAGRMLERGYNQSELIAVRICRKTGKEYMDVLVRTRETERQSDLDYMHRAENVRDAFECTGDVYGKRILLIDDVYTHGFTVSETAKALIERGAENVVCIAAAAAGSRH